MKIRLDLSKTQWARVSDILGNLGLITLTSAVIPALLEQFNILLAILGVVITSLFWYASIIVARRY